MIALDLGTTTIAARLFSGREVLAEVTRRNSTRIYGADVISRIQAAVSGNALRMKKLLEKDILDCVSSLIDANSAGDEPLPAPENNGPTKIVIAGNTTMEHLLFSYSCRGLGQFPYTPAHKGFTRASWPEKDVELVFLPGISAFVGADIVAGLYACGMERAEKMRLFIDLGTNGEMVLGNRDRLAACSAAAGPAFEGGNISCGMGSLPGAICSAKPDPSGKALTVRTMKNEEPLGLCGTGAVEVLAALLDMGIVDETGLLDEQYFAEGYPVAPCPSGEIVLTQKDIRELQLAKAAIRAGAESLLAGMRLAWRDLDEILLAGSFGDSLSPEKAVRIGLLPEEVLGKVKAAGNTSLLGAQLYAADEKAGNEAIRHILDVSEEIGLAQNEVFQENFLKQMDFPRREAGL